LQYLLTLPLYRLPIRPARVVLIPTLLLDLLLTLTVPTLRLACVAVLFAFPGSLVLAVDPFLLSLSFGLVSANSPYSVTVRTVLVLSILPTTLAIGLTLLTLLVLASPLFGLPLLDLGLASLLSLTLLLLPRFISLLDLLASLGTPNTTLPALLLGTRRDRCRRRTPLCRLLSLTLLATFGPLFLTLLLAFRPLLLAFSLLLLALFATIVTAPLRLGVRTKPGQRDSRYAE